MSIINMNNKDKIKTHLKNNKTFYISISVGIVVAGITLYIMRSRLDSNISSSVTGTAKRGPAVPEEASVNALEANRGVLVLGDSYALRPLDAKPTYWAHQPMQSPPTGHIGLTFSNSDVSDSFNIVNVIEREGKGHPGYMIRCIEDGLTYLSQKKAAVAYGVHPNRISDHINGRLKVVDGKHFERICMAA